MKGKFYIINNIDRPCERFVATKGEDGLFHYCNKDLKSNYKDGIDSAQATDIIDFGFEIEDHPDCYFFNLINPSSAMYNDGKKREWQGSTVFTIMKGKD